MSSPSVAGSRPTGPPTRPDFERIAPLLQGGGALGACPAGVYQAPAEADLHPGSVAGISIGAITSALIAGRHFPPHAQALRRATAKLLDQMPETLRRTPEADLLAQEADHKVHNIIHLIYRARTDGGSSKDYEFSRRTMEGPWDNGYSDMVRSVQHPEVLQGPQSPDGVFTFDLKQQGRDLELRK